MHTRPDYDARAAFLEAAEEAVSALLWGDKAKRDAAAKRLAEALRQERGESHG